MWRRPRSCCAPTPAGPPPGRRHGRLRRPQGRRPRPRQGGAPRRPEDHPRPRRHQRGRRRGGDRRAHPPRRSGARRLRQRAPAAACRGCARRRLTAAARDGHRRRQPLPGDALLVLPLPRRHLPLPPQGRRALRRGRRRQPLPLHLRLGAGGRPAVRGRLPEPQRHPDLPGGAAAARPGGGRTSAAPREPAAGDHRPRLPARVRAGLQPLRARRGPLDPQPRARGWRLRAGPPRGVPRLGAAGDRQARGRGGLGAGWPHGRVLPPPARPRRDRLRARGTCRRHARARHPALPAGARGGRRRHRALRAAGRRVPLRRRRRRRGLAR